MRKLGFAGSYGSTPRRKGTQRAKGGQDGKDAKDSAKS